MRHLFISLLTMASLCACGTPDKYAGLQKSLNEFVRDKDLTAGIAIIIDGRDTVAVNGTRQFPMLSVYKFPIALAFAEKCRQENHSFDFTVAISPADLHPDTYSPLTEKIMASAPAATDTLLFPARTLLNYMLQLSDNNASDIILRETGGVEHVDRYLTGLGAVDIHVRNTEDEMHLDNSLCYANSASPIAMARLIDLFDRKFNDSLSSEISHMMETASTGTGRLAKPLIAAHAVLGHKTGTGFTLPDGRLMAINDVGYVHLPHSGRTYSIAVFIENSGYDMEQTEAIISEISNIVLSHLK